MVGSGAGCEYRQFVFGDAHTLGQDNAEAVEECSLGDIRLRHAAQANLALCCGGQDHIMRLNTCEFFKDRSRRVSEAAATSRGSSTARGRESRPGYGPERDPRADARSDIRSTDPSGYGKRLQPV